MNIAERFGATIEVDGPASDDEGFFFVKRPDDVDHDAFVMGLMGVLGGPQRLVLHHRNGFAIIRVSFGRARRLRQLPWVATIGGINFDPERFANLASGPG